MKIKITSTEVETKSGKSKRTGNEYTMHTQAATAENARFRVPVRLTLGDDAKPFPIGDYEVDFDASVSISNYGDFGFNRQLTLVPFKAARAG
jgi:hypothetical protein